MENKPDWTQIPDDDPIIMAHLRKSTETISIQSRAEFGANSISQRYLLLKKLQEAKLNLLQVSRWRQSRFITNEDIVNYLKLSDFIDSNLNSGNLDIPLVHEASSKSDSINDNVLMVKSESIKSQKVALNTTPAKESRQQQTHHVPQTQQIYPNEIEFLLKQQAKHVRYQVTQELKIQETQQKLTGIFRLTMIPFMTCLFGDCLTWMPE
jgi:hypothetical protein